MRIRLSRTLSLLPLLAAPLAACSEPIDPANLADLAARHAREMVHQSGGGVAFTQEDGSGLNTIADGMQGAGDGLAGAMPSPMPPSMASAMGDSPLAAQMAGLPSMLTTEEEFDDTADQLKSGCASACSPMPTWNRRPTTRRSTACAPIRPAAASRARTIRLEPSPS